MNPTGHTTGCGWPQLACDFCDTLAHLRPCSTVGCADWIDDRDTDTGHLVAAPNTNTADGAVWLCRACLDVRACPHCLDGFTPAGVHAILGPVYRICRQSERCTSCANAAVFPADTRCLHCLTETLNTNGLTPVLCHACFGVLTVVPTTGEVTP
jgi:hypothetical protein